MADQCDQRRAEKHLYQRNCTALLVVKQCALFRAEDHETCAGTNGQAGLILVEAQVSDVRYVFRGTGTTIFGRHD
jgi:hypothetical protein